MKPAQSATLERTETPPKAKHDIRHVRGSSLMLTGRLLSMALNVLVQVVIVRYLSRTDYGAFAYALSFVSFGETLVTLGLDHSLQRFLPMYDENGERGKVLGTLIVVIGSVMALSVAIILLTLGLQGVISGRLIDDRDAVALLMILVFLGPVHAIDHLSIGILAVFSKPKAIFFRRYVLAPGLRLAVVGLLALGGYGVSFLATGYVVTGALASAGYLIVLWKVLRERGILSAASRASIDLPWKTIFAFGLPLLTTDLVYNVMHLSDVMLLGWFSTTSEIAGFRAVQPAARLNQVVLSSFAILFTPLAARLFARGDSEGLGKVYRQTAMWVTVITFPVLALTAGLAEPLTNIMFGERYSDAAIYMALLAAGSYVQAAAGFNGLTLKAYGSVKTIVSLNLVAAGANLALNIMLIPRFGALGAAFSTLMALCLHNFLKNRGLKKVSGIRLLQDGTTGVYLTVIAAISGLFAMQHLLNPPLVISALAAAGASLIVLRVARPQLAINEVFPELARFRVLRWIAVDRPPAPASEPERP